MADTTTELRTPTEPPSRRRLPPAWTIPLIAAAAFLLLLLLIAIIAWPRNHPAPATAGPPAYDTAAAERAATRAYLTYTRMQSQVETAGDITAADLPSVATQNVVDAESAFLKNLNDDNLRAAGRVKVTVTTATFSPIPAPSVVIEACVDSTAAKILDRSGTDVRTGPNGEKNYNTQYLEVATVQMRGDTWLVDSVETQWDRKC